MKLKLITLTTELNHPGLLKFKHTLDYFGYDYEIIKDDMPSGGRIFSLKMDLLYKWMVDNQDKYTHVIYADAWDSVALGSMEEIIEKLPTITPKFLGSTEKACYPNQELAPHFPETKYAWKYPNGGGWFAEIDFFIKTYESFPENGKNDQLWLCEMFLQQFTKGENVKLDTKCDIFQTLAFEHKGDFAITENVYSDKSGIIEKDVPVVDVKKSASGSQYRRLVNLQTKTLPIICHGNAHVPLDGIYSLFDKL